MSPPSDLSSPPAQWQWQRSTSAFVAKSPVDSFTASCLCPQAGMWSIRHFCLNKNLGLSPCATVLYPNIPYSPTWYLSGYTALTPPRQTGFAIGEGVNEITEELCEFVLELAPLLTGNFLSGVSPPPPKAWILHRRRSRVSHAAVSLTVLGHASCIDRPAYITICFRPRGQCTGA